MNRIILIGNGFDIAHGLKTKYENFINWYWEQRFNRMKKNHLQEDSDVLCSMNSKHNSWQNFFFFNKNLFEENCWSEIWDWMKQESELFDIDSSPFFERICKDFIDKGWVDIENEYYCFLKDIRKISNKSNLSTEELNKQLVYIQQLLIEYLKKESGKDFAVKENLRKTIYSPFHMDDVSVDAKQEVFNRLSADQRNGLGDETPSHVMLLNFNYTATAERYLNGNNSSINYIHGKLSDSKSIIFGYGDELDTEFKLLVKMNDNEYLRNVKSIRYLESDNYRRVLSFIESGFYQVFIMGHSCGLSDRTLLNTLFEHENCVSIKPFYYKKKDGTDNYTELVQNIYRNFTDKKMMRDRVVNYSYCEPMVNE